MPAGNFNEITWDHRNFHVKIVFPTKLSNDVKISLKDLFNVEDRYSENESLNIEYYKKVDDLEEEEEGGVQCVQQ